MNMTELNEQTNNLQNICNDLAQAIYDGCDIDILDRKSQAVVEEFSNCMSKQFNNSEYQLYSKGGGDYFDLVIGGDKVIYLSFDILFKDLSTKFNKVSFHFEVPVDVNNFIRDDYWMVKGAYFEKTEDIFTSFLEKNINELKAEFYIPFAIDSLIKNGTGRCELLSTTSRWFGVTFKEDRPGVVAKFQEFADQGIYPRPLYSK